ncbi:MAG TPA: c-type cytochrome [Pseudolabrys sp.]|jgi:mono/diheme cytochrome c family protein
MIRLPIAAALASVFALFSSAAIAESLTERGDYLVNTILTCQNCHTPKGPTGDIADKAFSGGLSFDEPPFKVTASNITQDPETGIGKWSDAEIKALLRTGVRPSGVPVAAVMPTGFYHIMTERDLNAVVAYLRTLKPIANKVPDPIYHFAAPAQTPPGGEKPYTEAMLKDRLKHGFYLATIGHCMECHTSMGPRGHDFAADLGKGGMEFPGPWGKSVSRNITSSKAKGLGDWSDADIKRAITTGVSKDGSHLKPPMGYGYYAKMTDSDLSDVIAYLRTVPAKE